MVDIGCQKPQPNPSTQLASINLLRGDIALCGNPEFGEVKFSLSCDYSVRETFDLAISLLHSFEYSEAEKLFVKVIDTDPDCAMAYWGVTMSIFHSLWMQSDLSYLEKGSKLLEIAENLPQSEREEAYIDAIGAFYKDWATIDQQTRILLYEKKMEDIYKKYEDDTEAAVFYALALRASADPTDKTYKNQIRSGEILEALFKEQPDHPGIAHYIIHNYDYPELAEMALPTARRYAEIAPASAHAQHMPSHIFTRLGLWEESIDTNINSTSSAMCYSESIDPEAHWAQEMHAMDYLVYAYLQMADNRKAIEQLKYLQAFEKVFPQDFAASYAAAAIPARIALENKHWTEAANLQLPSFEFPWEKFPWQKSILHFTRAMGSSHTGDIESAEMELGILQTLHQELEAMNDAVKSNQVLIQIRIVQAWIHFANENNQEAVGLMQVAAAMEEKTTKHPVTPGEVLPARELLGDMYLALDQPAKALEAYEKDLKRHPNRFTGIYGAATAAKQIGDMDKAAGYFSQLLNLAIPDSDRPEITEAREFVSHLG